MFACVYVCVWGGVACRGEFSFYRSRRNEGAFLQRGRNGLQPEARCSGSFFVE